MRVYTYTKGYSASSVDERTPAMGEILDVLSLGVQSKTDLIGTFNMG